MLHSGSIDAQQEEKCIKDCKNVKRVNVANAKEKVVAFFVRANFSYTFVVNLTYTVHCLC